MSDSPDKEDKIREQITPCGKCIIKNSIQEVSNYINDPNYKYIPDAKYVRLCYSCMNKKMHTERCVICKWRLYPNYSVEHIEELRRNLIKNI